MRMCFSSNRPSFNGPKWTFQTPSGLMHHIGTGHPRPLAAERWDVMGPRLPVP
jgi:hypothetical protein